MRTFLMCLTAAVSLLVPLVGCAEPAPAEVSLDTEFTLAVGQTATISAENLHIEFVEVVSDSRCPKGAMCIWAGEASCLIEITTADSTFRKVLTQPGLSLPSDTGFADYDITFDILPYPEVGKQIAAKDYRLQMVVSKTPA